MQLSKKISGGNIDDIVNITKKLIEQSLNIRKIVENVYNNTSKIFDDIKKINKDKHEDELLQILYKKKLMYTKKQKDEFTTYFNSILFINTPYEEEYKKSAIKCSVRVSKTKDLGQAVTEACAETNSGNIGFEADHFTYQGYLGLKKLLGNKKLIPLAAAVENIRMIKDDSEIRDIRQACKDGAKLMNHAVKITKPGESENSVKRKLEAYALKNHL